MTGLLASRRCCANNLGMWPIPEGTLRGTGDTDGWPVVKRGTNWLLLPKFRLSANPFWNNLWRDAVYAHMRVGIVLPLLSLWTWFSCSPSFASPLPSQPCSKPARQKYFTAGARNAASLGTRIPAGRRLERCFNLHRDYAECGATAKAAENDLGFGHSGRFGRSAYCSCCFGRQFVRDQERCPGEICGSALLWRFRQSARCGRRRAGLAYGTLANRDAAWKGHRRLVDCTKVQTAGAASDLRLRKENRSGPLVRRDSFPCGERMAGCRF